VETCKVFRSAGTSMATPVVAGAAAIIRQYFEDPRFYATQCTSGYPLCNAFSPKGSTVKAMLVNSGEPMSNYYAGSTKAGRTTTEPTAELGMEGVCDQTGFIGYFLS
jgi:subtilisin family serine protease